MVSKGSLMESMGEGGKGGKGYLQSAGELALRKREEETGGGTRRLYLRVWR